MRNQPNGSASAVDARAAVIDRILTVAGDEARRVGPEKIRMGEIASRADVSRASLYRYFASKDDLIRAYTMREFDNIFGEIDDTAKELDDFDERFVEAFALALCDLREHEVFKAILHINERGIMRSTLQSGDAIEHARDLTVSRINTAVRDGELQMEQYDAEIVSELTVRLLISLIETPESIARFDTQDDARKFARRYVVPLVAAISGRQFSRN